MSDYTVSYKNYTWVVINTKTNEGVVCFPTQIAAINWINTKQLKHTK